MKHNIKAHRPKPPKGIQELFLALRFDSGTVGGNDGKRIAELHQNGRQKRQILV